MEPETSIMAITTALDWYSILVYQFLKRRSSGIKLHTWGSPSDAFTLIFSLETMLGRFCLIASLMRSLCRCWSTGPFLCSDQSWCETEVRGGVGVGRLVRSSIVLSFWAMRKT